MSKYLLILLFTLISLFGYSQSSNPVKWNMIIENSEEEGIRNLKISAEIENKWQLYSNDFNPDLGPMVTEFSYTVSSTFGLVGGTLPKNSKRKYDELWGGDYSYFEKEAEFNQLIKINSDNPEVKVMITYQVCNSIDGKCIPFDVTLNLVKTE